MNTSLNHMMDLWKGSTAPMVDLGTYEFKD